MHSIPQISFMALQQVVLTWLLGLNTRRIQAHLPLVAAFMTGTMWVRGAASCLAIAAGGAFSHDALNRLLLGRSLRGLLQMAALTLVERNTGYLVIDDIVLEKSGKKIAGLAWLKSSRLGIQTRALNVVVLGWTDGKRYVPLSFRFWKPPMSRDQKNRPSAKAFDETPFKTKLQLANELLDWAYQANFWPTAVLFDAYYLTGSVLARLRKYDWQWVSRTKANRNFMRGTLRFKPTDWVELASQRKAPSLNSSLPLHLHPWGGVRLIAVRRREQGDWRFLIGSNPYWGRDKVLRLYGHRWGIEVSFRDGRQDLGLGDCQCRTWQAQENHFALVLLTMVFLDYQRQNGESRTAAITRLKNRPLRLAALPLPPKVRHIKLEKRARPQDRLPNSISARSA